MAGCEQSVSQIVITECSQQGVKCEVYVYELQCRVCVAKLQCEMCMSELQCRICISNMQCGVGLSRCNVRLHVGDVVRDMHNRAAM